MEESTPQIVAPSFEVLFPSPFDGTEMLKLIEGAGRTCYKSEAKITKDSAQKFVAKIGYPDRWEDYSKLDIVAGDLVGNRMRVNRFNYELFRERLLGLGLEHQGVGGALPVRSIDDRGMFISMSPCPLPHRPGTDPGASSLF